MKKIVLAVAIAAATVLGASSASATDVFGTSGRTATGGWSGFYFGGNFGYANSYGEETIAGRNALSALVVATGIVPGSLSTRADGWLGGAQIGYNYQFGQLVAGFEADFDWTNLKGSDGQTLTAAPLGFPAALVVKATRGSDWIGTARLRLGTTLLSPSVLIYATGGVAWAEVHGTTTATLTFGPAAFTATDSYSKKKVGWTVGGGLEYALTKNWSAKAEYLYVDLGDHDGTMAVVVAGAPINFAVHQKLDEHLVRAGFNYRF